MTEDEGRSRILRQLTTMALALDKPGSLEHWQDGDLNRFLADIDRLREAGMAENRKRHPHTLPA
ncbi:MAG: hypothetical protein ACLP36_07335 [Acidimicrobiales bacterium]